MSQWLRQSTAVTRQLGPFIDDTDGKTPEIALDITEQEVLLSKNGGAFTLKSETTHGVHDASHNGWYTILLDTTDTNTLGCLDIAINMAGALPVWKSFMVVTADAWDSFFGAVVIGQAGAQAALVANNLDHLAKTACSGADMTTEITDNTILGYILGAGDTSTFVPSTDGLHAAGVDLDAILADTTTIDTAGEIAAAVWSADATTYQTQGTFGQAIGDPAADANTIYKAVVTDATGATVGVDVVAVKAETALIVADTETIDTAAEIAAAVWSADATSYQTQGTFGQAIGDPAADANTIYKAVVTDATGATVGVDVVAMKAETVLIVADTNELQTDWHDGGRLDLILDAATAPSAATVAAAVWDLDATAHQTLGTFGQAIGDPVADANTIYKAVVSDATGATVGVDVVAVKAETALIVADTETIDTAAEIAAAVWSADATSYQTQGTFGQAIGDPAADANTIYKAVVTDATGATVGADVVTLTTTVGAAGAGLTSANIGQAALVANNLDHLALTATGGADMTTEVADNTILSRILGNGDTSTFVPSTDGLHAAGVDLDSVVASAGTAAAYAIVNSGMGFRGTVTAVPGANQFTIGTLAGLGAGAFADSVSPWYALVFRDAGGAAAAPQGEFKKVTAYVTATGAFTTDAFTAAVAAGDDIIIINPRLADLASIRVSTDAILVDTNELQTDWTNGGRLDLLLDGIGVASWDLTNGIETGLTPRQAMRLIAAACAGKVSGAGTATVVIRNPVVDGTDRIVATVDVDGNRTAVAYDLT